MEGSGMRKSVEMHYADEKSIAFAYLCAIGAKALTITELNPEEQQIYIEKLEYEALVNVGLKKDQEIKSFIHKIMSAEGVKAIKISRRRERRLINLYVISHDNLDYLCWKSKYGTNKYFSLLSLTNVESAPDILESDQMTSPIQIARTLRISNDRRSLSLIFLESFRYTPCNAVFSEINAHIRFAK